MRHISTFRLVRQCVPIWGLKAGPQDTYVTREPPKLNMVLSLSCREFWREEDKIDQTTGEFTPQKLVILLKILPSLRKDNSSKYLCGEQFTFFLSHKCLTFIKDSLITCTNCRCWSQVCDPEDHLGHFWMTCASKNVPYVYQQWSFWNSLQGTQSICHAAGSHITRGVRQLLSEGLWFSDQETPVMLVTLWGKHGAGTLVAGFWVWLGHQECVGLGQFHCF